LTKADVIWVTDPFRDSDDPRPWLVLSDTRHPFHGEEYVCALMTTTDRPEAIPVEASDWISGGSPLTSFVSPWVPMTVKDHAIENKQGTVRRTIARRVAEEVVTYVRAR